MDAFTSNLIQLAVGVISKTGAACAWLTDGKTAPAKSQGVASLMAVRLGLRYLTSKVVRANQLLVQPYE